MNFPIKLSYVERLLSSPEDSLDFRLRRSFGQIFVVQPFICHAFCLASPSDKAFIPAFFLMMSS